MIANSSSLKVIGIIPVRLGSTRFPRKPLADIAGKSMVQRVWEQVKKSRLCSEVYVATGDSEIADHVNSFGGQVAFTTNCPQTGSDRVAEAIATLRRSRLDLAFDLVANIQGDMPFINPSVIDDVCRALGESDESFGMATPVTPIVEREEFERGSVVKAVMANSGAALYFSRAPIPFWRAKHPNNGLTPWGYKHLGLYVFRPEVLSAIPTLASSPLEQSEGLEQLRALESGVKILAVKIERARLEPSIEVDTPEDLQRAIRAALQDSSLSR